MNERARAQYLAQFDEVIQQILPTLKPAMDENKSAVKLVDFPEAAAEGLVSFRRHLELHADSEDKALLKLIDTHPDECLRLFAAGVWHGIRHMKQVGRG